MGNAIIWLKNRKINKTMFSKVSKSSKTKMANWGGAIMLMEKTNYENVNMLFRILRPSKLFSASNVNVAESDVLFLHLVHNLFCSWEGPERPPEAQLYAQYLHLMKTNNVVCFLPQVLNESHRHIVFFVYS